MGHGTHFGQFHDLFKYFSSPPHFLVFFADFLNHFLWIKNQVIHHFLPLFKHAKVGRIWDAICWFWFLIALGKYRSFRAKKWSVFHGWKKNLWIYVWEERCEKNTINLDVYIKGSWEIYIYKILEDIYMTYISVVFLFVFCEIAHILSLVS